MCLTTEALRHGGFRLESIPHPLVPQPRSTTPCLRVSVVNYTVPTADGRRRKFFSNVTPALQRKLSGWNWTPWMG